MKYVDHDGTLKLLVCVHCGGEIHLIEETENSKRYGCSCGKTLSLALNMGELDLGIVRDFEQNPGDYVIYGEAFAPKPEPLVGAGGFVVPHAHEEVLRAQRYGFFKVYTHREPWYWRPLLWLFRMPSTWQEIEFCPPAPPLRDVLPSFKTARGGIQISE